MKWFFPFLLMFSLPGLADTSVGLEAGSVENSYNRVAIPGDDGTPFNMARSFPDNNLYYRLSFWHEFNDRHGIRALYAPLRLEGDATYGGNINFQGENFGNGGKTYTDYEFNSYRLSYFYQLLKRDNWLLRLGATAKIRDAEVTLSQGGLTKTKSNTGVVPLFYLYSEYRMPNSFRFALDFDGWAAPQGRAFDVALMGGYPIYDQLHLNVGYRMLEGGADNDNVYNFAQLNYMFASVDYQF